MKETETERHIESKTRTETRTETVDSEIETETETASEEGRQRKEVSGRGKEEARGDIKEGQEARHEIGKIDSRRKRD